MGRKLTLAAVLAVFAATVSAQNSTRLNSANFVQQNASWYEPWTPNAPSEFTQNATLPQIWLTGVSGTAVRTQMQLLMRDTINFAETRTGVWLNYTIANVSISPWVNNTVTWGMGITPLSTTNFQLAQNASKGRGILEFPIFLGSLSIFHSVPGVNIRLSGPVAAQIFQGNITYWNDPQISNTTGIPTSQLPNQKIKLAVRSDSTAQTGYIAQYFNRTYPSGWKLGVNNTLAWNEWATFSCNGSTACANYVSQNPYAITYLESWSGNNQSNSDDTFWEVPMLNMAGQYKKSTNAQWDTMAVVVPKVPSRWTNANFLNLPDDNVFPIVYAVYVYTNGELKVNGTVGAAMKQMYGFWLSSTVQGSMQRNYRGQPLPEKILTASVRYWAAINATSEPVVGWPELNAQRYLVAAS